MDEYLLPSFAVLVASFCGAVLFLHALISGYKTGVVYVRGGAFYRKRTGLRNASDYWFIMAFQAFVGLLCFLLFGLLLTLLPTSNHGLALVMVGLVINAGIALRRPPEKRAQSNTAFSFMSIAGSSILLSAIALGLVQKPHNVAFSLLAMFASAFIVTIHAIRIKSGKFLLKYRKPRLKPDRTSRNA